MTIAFTKMQGLGNDFAVIDATSQPLALTAEQIQRMAHRRFGIGFDQLLVLEPSTAPGADFNYRIYNSDGSQAWQCGNGARCIAKFIHQRRLSDKKELRLHLANGDIFLRMNDDDTVTVNMGEPSFAPEDLPFVTTQSPPCYHLRVADYDLEFAVVSVGNPHAVVQVTAAVSAEMIAAAEALSRHPAFPSGVNVGFMQIDSPGAINLTVVERGAGQTLACGSGACAAVAAGIHLGILQSRVDVKQQGGHLTIEWSGPGHPLWMQGPAQCVYEGEWLV